MKTLTTALILALAAPLIAAAAEPSETFDTPPAWRKKPTPQDLLAVWPTKALSQGVDGRAVIECKVSLEGALFDCKALDESPAGMGFGSAAVALTPQLLMKPATKAGRPVVSTIKMPVDFKGLKGRPSAGSFGSRKMLSQVAWTAAPSYAEAAAAFPQKARNTATPGHVALQCTLKADGGLSACNVISEQPKALGFGKAAQGLAGKFRAPTTTAAGEPTKGLDVHLAVTFAIEMLGAEPRIGKPQWLGLPSADEMRASLPQAAVTIEGRTVLDCRVAAGGHVEDCRVAEETPAGLGFGAASLGVSNRFVLSLWTDEGLPTLGGRVRVPIRYTLK